MENLKVTLKCVIHENFASRSAHISLQKGILVNKRLRGLSPSCAFAVFALPFRKILAVMAMGVARQSEGERLKFET